MRLPARILLGLCPLVAATALAHGPVARQSEEHAVAARLFTADAATGEVVVIDLPGADVVTRLPTPPFILGLGVDPARRHIYAMRGRNTDRDTVTVIDAGFGDDGLARFPTIMRTFTGTAPGGVRDGFLPSVGGHPAIFEELVGEVEILDDAQFASLGAVPSRRIKLAAPDHYHYLEEGKYLYFGHLAKGMVQIIDRDTGAEVTRIPGCPVLHGMAKDDVSGRLFFACMNGVLVVGTRGREMNTEVARIPYPSAQRIGSFLKGKGRVFWGKGEGALPALQRLDVSKEPYSFTMVPVDASIQQGTSEDGGELVVYSRNGTLDFRDGGTGELLKQVAISKAYDGNYHEHVDKALLPDIVVDASRAWVSIPPEGVIVELDTAEHKELRRIATGGQPTRLVLVKAPVVPSKATTPTP
jgi:hypothetical protein